MIQHTLIPTEGVKTLRKRQSSLPITPLFWGSGWGHGGPAVVALTSPVSRSFLGRWNQEKLNKRTTEHSSPYGTTPLGTRIARSGMICGLFHIMSACKWNFTLQIEAYAGCCHVNCKKWHNVLQHCISSPYTHIIVLLQNMVCPALCNHVSPKHSSWFLHHHLIVTFYLMICHNFLTSKVLFPWQLEVIRRQIMDKFGWDNVVPYTDYFNLNMAARSHSLPLKCRRETGYSNCTELQYWLKFLKIFLLLFYDFCSYSVHAFG
jgi:hypothetical protein